jgi:hypothetical protein
MTGPTPAGEPTDTRRVIRLPRATRLLATLLAAWLVCAAVAFALMWFTPLGIAPAHLVVCPVPPPKYCMDHIVSAKQLPMTILVLRAAALGTAFWVAYLGVRVVRSRVRFTVG